jgi:hypothetical protein
LDDNEDDDDDNDGIIDSLEQWLRYSHVSPIPSEMRMLRVI